MTPFRGDLIRHPASPDSPVKRISVEVARAGDAAVILYTATGDMSAIALPAPAGPARRDELWRATCFELFTSRVGQDGYREWNFAPGGAWAAYRFDGYRTGMRDADVTAPVIVTEPAEGRLRIAVTVSVSNGPLQIGLSAVIRDTDGGTSYWALAHPPGKPDFHHADCFATELAPSPRA